MKSARPSILLLCAAALAVTACKATDASKPDADRTPREAPTSWPPNSAARDLTPTTVPHHDVLLRGATILTGSGDPIQGGDVLLRGGLIEQVSATPIDPVPEGVEVIDAAGKFITAGLIDTHSHLGVYPTPHVAAHADGNEMTSPTTPDVDAVHSVWPQDPGFQRALAGGVTTLQILPGSANLVGGRAATLQLHPGISAEAMRFPTAPIGLKMACGENPKRVYGGRGARPSTRMGNMAVWRATFAKAKETERAWDEYLEASKKWAEDPNAAEADKPKEPKRDLAMETLVGVLRGDILVHVHCYRADEMIQVLQLADEFGFEIRSFHHAVEAYKIRDILADWDVSVSTWADWWGFKIEAHDAILYNAALLDQAGARAIIHSDSALDIQRLNQEAAKAYWAAKHAGIPVTENDALAWITSNPAWALGIQDVTGTLEPGKRADVTVWSEHPLSVYAQADLVFVEGALEFDRASNPTPWSDFEAGHLHETRTVTPPTPRDGGKP